MTTKTKTTKATTNARNTKKATKAQSAKPATKNAPVAKRDAKESRTNAKKISQIEAAIIVLGKSKDAMNCKAMVEAMRVGGFRILTNTEFRWNKVIVGLTISPIVDRQDMAP